MSTDRWFAISGGFNGDSPLARGQLNKLIAFAKGEAVEEGLIEPEEAKRHINNLDTTQLNPQSPQVQESILILTALYDSWHPLERAG
jgi:hypothetical protein